MERSWYWRLLLVVGLTAVAVFQSAPSFIYFMADAACRRDRTCLAEKIPDWLPEKRITLGIDLQGGLHLVMGVDAVKAVQNRADRVGDEIVEAMKEKGKTVKSVGRKGDAPELNIELESDGDFDTLKTVLDAWEGTWEVSARSGGSVLFAMLAAEETRLREDAVAQALKTLRNRIDTYGVTEPEVRKRGNESVLIQIAGLTGEDEESVKENILGKTAQLEFKLVDDEGKYFAELESRLPPGVTLELDSFRGDGDALISSQFLASKERASLEKVVEENPPPSDRTVRYQKIRQGEQEVWRTWLLDRRTPLTGDSLVSAFVAYDNDKSQYYVALKFDRRGAVAFDRLTGENIRKRMAIVLDDTVDSAPVIQSRIPNGNASITLGGFKSQQEILEDAKSLSVVLNAGALPAPVYTQEERTVGATLGDDAIAKGKLALLAAMLLMMVMMIGYYRVSGAIAVVALALNMLGLLAVLSAFGATLTLPGIAGLALTMGMAVDANIIQFERIREELGLGKSPRAAIDAGFDKAFSAIFDANVTSLIAAIVLYQYGSGPIRGFATTLGVGVVINTFTAVVVPRMIFDYLVRAVRVEKVSI